MTPGSVGSDPPVRLQMLTVAEARLARLAVHRNEHAWRRPSEADRQVAVLGLPSYSITNSHADYAADARSSNAAMRSFAWLHARLADTLRPLLERLHPGPLLFDDDRARPGFHILIVGDERVDPRGWLGGPHWDGGFLNLPWSPELPDVIDFTRLVSFTMPIVLPRAGGGLRVWPLTSGMLVEAAASRDVPEAEILVEMLEPLEPSSHEYRLGELFVHTGHHVHEVLPWTPTIGDERITLQGHALHHDGAWHLYW